MESGEVKLWQCGFFFSEESNAKLNQSFTLTQLMQWCFTPPYISYSLQANAIYVQSTMASQRVHDMPSNGHSLAEINPN